MNVFDSFKSIVIIGNGFDLNCGLKTRYKNVYDSYLLTPSKNSTIKKFKADISSSYGKWSDFEIGMAKYAETFDSENGFIECLDDFSSFMHLYLKNIQSSYHDNWEKLKTHDFVKSSFVNSINNLGKGLSHNIDSIFVPNVDHNISNIGFISLNYTDIFDSLLDNAFSTYFYHDPIHVHGLLGDDPILGMDRDEQLSISFVITDRLRRHFIKPFFNSEYDNKRIERAYSIIDQANYVFVYGASFGDSDLSWREKLLNWLCSSDDHHLFIYFHDNESKAFPTVATRNDYEIDKKNDLISQWNLSCNDIPLKRLHLPCGIKLFDIESALNKDIERNSKRV